MPKGYYWMHVEAEVHQGFKMGAVGRLAASLDEGVRTLLASSSVALSWAGL